MAGSSSDTLVGVLGWSATVCFALILAPQIVLNQMRRSCEGFSISLLLLWHIGAVAAFPFFMFEDEPLPLMLQGGLFTLASVVCEVQFYAFRPEQDEPPARWKLWALGLASFLLSAGTIVGFMALFTFVTSSPSAWLIEGFGSVVSSLCFALGFIPQINLIFATRSSEGFSVGVSLLDLTGSLLSIAVLVLEAKGHRPDVGAIMPYAIIVSMQSLLLVFSLVIYPDPKRWQHTRTLTAAAVEQGCRLPRLAALIRGGHDATDTRPRREKELAALPPSPLDLTRHTTSAASALFESYTEGGGMLWLSPSPSSASSSGCLHYSSSSEEEEAEEEEGRSRPIHHRHRIRAARGGEEEGGEGFGVFVDVEMGKASEEEEEEEGPWPPVAAAFAPPPPRRQRRKSLAEEEAPSRLEPSQ